MKTIEQITIPMVEDDLPLSDEELKALVEDSTNEKEETLPEEETDEQEESADDSADETEESDTETPAPATTTKKEDKLNPYEQVILKEMERRASEDGDTLVADALNSEDKNIHECFAYVRSQAQKQAKSGCAMIEDAVVYGWAHHYYIEPKEVIDKEMHPKPKTTPKTDTATKPVSKTATTTKTETKPKKKSTYNDNPLLKSLSKKAKKEEDTKKKGGEETKKVKKNGIEFTITEFSLF